MSSQRQTQSKILCTLGPASSSLEMIRNLRNAGMDCVRINFSHGTKDDKQGLVDRIKEADPTLAILCDIQGPKLRIGEVGEGGVILERGNRLVLTTDEVMGNEERVSISYKELPNEVQVGELIFINDGIICLEVFEVQGSEIRCEILTGGAISSRKGMNLPSTKIALKVPTPKDVEDLKLIAELNPAYVAASFVGEASDVNTIRHILQSHGNFTTRIIAKIERPVAVDNFNKIIQVADGIMVARGDLGVELKPEEVPFVQKEMIKQCNWLGKPVIVATQMLESMIKAPVPTRAEVSDVYNAIGDGADCVMLSAETASGDHPIEAVKVMRRIIHNSEAHLPLRNPDFYNAHSHAMPEVLGHLVHDACLQLKSQGYGQGKILCLTKSGFTARMISKYRPSMPIIAVTHEERSFLEMSILWGVRPLLLVGLEKLGRTRERIHAVVEECLRLGWLDEKETVIMVGDFFDLGRSANQISLFQPQELLNRQ